MFTLYKYINMSCIAIDIQSLFVLDVYFPFLFVCCLKRIGLFAVYTMAVKGLKVKCGLRNRRPLVNSRHTHLLSRYIQSVFYRRYVSP